jgi:hypothetical protein
VPLDNALRISASCICVRATVRPIVTRDNRSYQRLFGIDGSVDGPASSQRSLAKTG